VNTGKDVTSPAEKRDLAIKEAGGQICAFIDDDAYPHRDWLKNAVTYFDDDTIGAVGGPGLTPQEDSYMMRAGGLCYESIIGSASNQYRFVKKPRRDVDDYPAYNLLIRKSVLEAIGGFGTTFYGGEDTKLCADIVRLGKKIVYTPNVVTYHHRRPLFWQHLRQVANVGLHRGYFTKVLPETSRRLVYFLPSLLALDAGMFLVALVALPELKAVFAFPLLIVLVGAFADCLWRSKKLAMAALSSVGIVLMLIVYGISFMRGRATKELKR
jgi:GT2 family glycosyltransferase